MYMLRGCNLLCDHVVLCVRRCFPLANLSPNSHFTLSCPDLVLQAQHYQVFNIFDVLLFRLDSTNTINLLLSLRIPFLS